MNQTEHPQGRAEASAKRKHALLAGILAGITSPGMVGAHVEYPRLSGSDLGRLRNDVQRVGRDFENVIQRKRGEKSDTSSGTAT